MLFLSEDDYTEFHESDTPEISGHVFAFNQLRK